MEIRKKYVAYSHRPGFRKLGQTWNREPRTIGVVDALPDDGSRDHDDVDLLATKKEIAWLIRRNAAKAYPLRIAEGATDASNREVAAARKELDQLRQSIAEARQEHEQHTAEAAAARAELEALRSELAELYDAVEAAENEARAKEAEVEKLKKQLAQSKPNRGTRSQKADRAGKTDRAGEARR